MPVLTLLPFPHHLLWFPSDSLLKRPPQPPTLQLTSPSQPPTTTIAAAPQPPWDAITGRHTKSPTYSNHHCPFTLLPPPSHNSLLLPPPVWQVSTNKLHPFHHHHQFSHHILILNLKSLTYVWFPNCKKKIIEFLISLLKNIDPIVQHIQLCIYRHKA